MKSWKERSVGEMDSVKLRSMHSRDGGVARYSTVSAKGLSKLVRPDCHEKPVPLEGNGTMPMLFRSMIERTCVPRSEKSVPPDLSLCELRFREPTELDTLFPEWPFPPFHLVPGVCMACASAAHLFNPFSLDPQTSCSFLQFLHSPDS